MLNADIGGSRKCGRTDMIGSAKPEYSLKLAPSYSDFDDSPLWVWLDYPICLRKTIPSNIQ